KYFKEIAEKFREDVLVKHPKAGIMIENQNPVIFSAAMQKLMENLRIDSLHGRHLQAPQVYKPAEEYALEMSKKTFGNVAWESYKKYGSKSPIINIENPPAGFGLSRAKDLADLAEGSRKKFVENAVRKGMSESEAKRWAEKLIGVTWDVGHINQLRQFGFSSEDIIKEAEKVGHLVKHVHLSDNFGMENVELPMGMGNVDLKKVMEALKKKGTDVDKIKKIAETGHWWQHMQTSPVGLTMEALGSPMYGAGAPYWNQSPGLWQGYFGGYGAFLPQINYETFGAGFSNLPTELGGQRQQTGRSRMGGTPME
ncbi:MAG TPA: TIM barrel protein, partial [Candidatus Nanoarchaeia archaeon]|nr:TIM barrel protein [Candidatus Nanoarchaeia archaeon]